MSAYIYGNIEIHDPALYEQYRAVVPAMIAAHGGRYLVRGGAVEVLEGDGKALRQVILEFPDMASLKGFYDSPEYQAILPISKKSARRTVFVLEGI